MLISRSAGARLPALLTGTLLGTILTGTLLTGSLAAQDVDPSDRGLPYARVSTPRVSLRVFPTDNSPTFEDTMTQGSVVLVGESYGAYRQVVTPLGPVGYVHKKFSSEPEAGKLLTSGLNVAFRYRPLSGEAPVTLLPDETELHVVGEDGDWWQVRLPGGQAWLQLEDLQVFDAPNETLVATYSELEKQQRKMVEETEAARVLALAEAQVLAEQEQRLGDIRDQITKETSKPTAEQDYTALGADLATLIDELDADSVVLVNARLLSKEVDRYMWAVEATLVVQEEPIPAADASMLVREKVEDPLTRFDAVGWLRYSPSAAGMDRFVVEKGGQTLFWLTCSSARYDLSLFDGVEVGVIGGTDRPDRESMRVVDVQKIEVVGLPQ